MDGITRPAATTLIILALLSAAACAQEWPTFRGDYIRSGAAYVKSHYNLTDMRLLWTFNATGPVESSPAASDISGDGLRDIVFGSDDRSVYAIDHEGRLLWRHATGGMVKASPSIGDVNGDGRADVVIGSDDGRLYALDRAGDTIWSYKTPRPVRSSPVIADLDGVPGMEVVFGSMDGNIYCLDGATGRLKWAYETAEAIESSPTLYDIDGDGKKEIIIGSNDNIVYVLKNPPYKVWMHPTNGDVSATANIDRSGRIIVGSGDGSVYRLGIKSLGVDETRRIRTEAGWEEETISISGLSEDWRYNASGPVRSSAASGFVMNKSAYGSVFGSDDRNMYFISADGLRNASYTLSKGIDSSPALADLNGDNHTEVIFGSDDGSLYIINYPGARAYSYRTGGAVKSSPAVADLTGDGSLEVIVGSYDGSVYVFGDMRSRTIARGDELYRRAFTLYGIGDVDGARETASNASSVYATVGYAAGSAKCGLLFKRIDADLMLAKAIRQYNDGDSDSAKARISLIARIYEEINDSRGGDKAEALRRRIEADTYYAEAKYYIDQGMRANATEYIEAARIYYRSVNDTAGLKRVEGLSSYTKNYDKAETYLQDGRTAIVGGRFQEARMLIGFARMSYELAKDDEGVRRAEDMLAEAKAEEAYANAKTYLNASEYDKADVSLELAINLYRNISPDGQEKAAALRRTAVMMRAAGQLMEEARIRYEAAYFDDAAEYARNASRLYEDAGDREGYVKAMALLQDALNGGRLSGTYSTGDWLMAAIVLVAAAAIGWSYYMKRRIDGFQKELAGMRQAKPVTEAPQKPRAPAGYAPAERQRRRPPQTGRLGVAHKTRLLDDDNREDKANEPPK